MPHADERLRTVLDGAPREADGVRGTGAPRRSGRLLLMLALALLLLGGLTVLPQIRGDRGPWTEVFVEEFDTPVPLGGFPGDAYSSRWTSYDGLLDTSEVGTYEPSQVLSVDDGALDMYLHTADGRPLGAAPIPLVDGRWGGQVYGRFAVRFRSDPIPGFGAGWLLWPDSNVWAEGEIDFAEGGLDNTVRINQHCVGRPEEKCLAVDTGVPFSGGWHEIVVEWTPSGVEYLLDGRLVGSARESPSTPFHLVLQTATMGEAPDPDVSGHVRIDRVSISAWTPS